MFRTTQALRSAHSARVRKAATNSILLKSYSKSMSARFACILILSSATAYTLARDMQDAWEEYKEYKNEKDSRESL